MTLQPKRILSNLQKNTKILECYAQIARKFALHHQHATVDMNRFTGNVGRIW